MASRINPAIYKVSDFISWQKSGSLTLSPSFQRRPVWSPRAKSYLVDTVIRGLPVPAIFLRDLPSELDVLEPKREVVDGQQRIRTLFSYISPALLGDFDEERDAFKIMRSHNRGLAGRPFFELEDQVRQDILDYQFNVQVLPSHTDDRDILEIFSRMNATGVRLNAQELRNAEFLGEFKTLMYSLAAEQLPRWRSWRIFTENDIARMDEVEMTSELTSVILVGLSGKSKSSLDGLYRQYEESFPFATEAARRFRSTMDAIDGSLGAELHMLPLRRKPLFYSLFAAFYISMFGDVSVEQTQKATPVSAQRVNWIRDAGRRIAGKEAPKDVLDSTSKGTTHIGSRRVVVAYLLRG